METDSRDDHDILIHLIRQLRKRIKELECSYVISDIAARPNGSIYQIIQDITDRIPHVFQQPEHTCARVTIGPKITQTDNCNSCQWKLDTSITANGKVAGVLEVGYTGEPPHNGSPFLDEEKKLLQLIAAHIGLIVHSNTLKDTLALSDNLYRNLVDNYPVGIFRSNLKGELLYANAACLHMFGYDSLQAAIEAGSTLRVYKNPADRTAMLEMLERTGRVADYEVECLTRTGESVFVLASATLESDVITAILMDITDRKLAENALERSEKRFRTLADNALVGIFQTNLKGGVLYINDVAARMCGYESLEEAMAAGPLEVYRNPEDRKTLIGILKQTGKVADFELELKTKAGESIIVLLSASLESDVITGMMRDITANKRTEEALRFEREQLLSLFDSMDLLIYVSDPSTNEILYMNKTMENLFGRQAVGGICYREFQGLESPCPFCTNEMMLKQHPVPYHWEYYNPRIDRHFSIIDRFIKWPDGRNVRFEVATDITKGKREEQYLEEAFNQIKSLKEQLEAENVYLRDEIELKEGYGGVIGTSDSLRYVMYRIQQVAPTGTTVLLTGETGTGKGIFARLIHRASDRRDRPFVNVNCAGLPANLIESELFGREKGAFTGSTARQIGRFELANGGTIFLDEIGELPLELQAKLLKVIEDREFERLGSPHTMKVDVRVVASTNRNLEEEVKKGKFRQDLYYRLSVFPVTIPPLRHRKEDIPLLVRAYVKRFQKAYHKDIKKISKNTMEFLENYAWPGNVRELINVVERAVIVSDGPELRLAEKTDTVPVKSVREERTPSAGSRETKALAEAEREHILRTLQETGWRIEGKGGTAQLLQIHPNTLRARMKKLGIKRPGR